MNQATCVKSPAASTRIAGRVKRRVNLARGGAAVQSIKVNSLVREIIVVFTHQ